MPTRPTPDDFEPGPSSSEHLNELSRGNIASEERFSDSTGTATILAILATDELTLKAGRKYRVMAQVSIRSDITGGTQVALHMNGSQIQRKNNDAAVANSDLSYDIWKNVVPDDDVDAVFELIVGVSGSDGNTVQSRADGPAGVNGCTTLDVDEIGPFFTGS